MMWTDVTNRKDNTKQTYLGSVLTVWKRSWHAKGELAAGQCLLGYPGVAQLLASSQTSRLRLAVKRLD
eukprot:1160297-Pelagomonas_calceolata.AAC.6